MLANKLNCSTGEKKRSMVNRSLSRTQILKRELRSRLEEEESASAAEQPREELRACALTDAKAHALSSLKHLLQKLCLLCARKKSP